MTGTTGTYLDDGGDELLQEVVMQQRGPVMMDEVNEKTFNVRSVLILCNAQTLSITTLQQSPEL